ncbi:CASP-like protein PIMP1 [Nicotiana tabacum]|uniref:CASP-like protein n=2 Tax=Nicotiana TaxID=4085 RepID=A0A1S4A3V5_TOBAC|nr:PREDICTED: CASP-like protein PIMP1 [Nicotiana tabacum]
MDQNQTSSTVIIDDQSQTPSTTTIDQNQTPAPAASPVVGLSMSLVVSLVMRVLTFILLLISLIVIASASFDTFDIYGFPVTIKSNDFYAYRYMISADVIGMAYTLLLAVLTISHFIKSGSSIGSGLAYFEFYGDKVISFLLGTGAAAGLGLGVEFNKFLDSGEDIQNFINMANAAASMLLLGSVCSTISSFISSLNLPNRSKA